MRDSKEGSYPITTDRMYAALDWGGGVNKARGRVRKEREREREERGRDKGVKEK